MRKCCFSIKRFFVIGPARNLMGSVLVGFAINLALMMAIMNLYHKHNLNDDTYSQAFDSLIAGAIAFLCCVGWALIMLSIDLISKGCFSWHREALASLLQELTIGICILVTLGHMREYFRAYEAGGSISPSEQS